MTLLVYDPHVKDDVDEAYAWYEQESLGLGDRYLAALEETLLQIAENPRLYGIVYRRVSAAIVRPFPYVVYYRIERKRVRVIAIQHGHRNPTSWRRRV